MLTTILYGFLLSWFFTQFPLFTWMVGLIPSNKYTSALISALKCHKCCGFWITLILFLDPISAIATSFLAATYSKVINALPTYI